MKNNCLLACLLFFLAPDLSAQQLPPAIQWQKCLGGTRDDIATTVLHTVDNALLLAGSSKSNDGDVSGHHGSIDSTDAWIVKISATGTVLWQKSLGGSGNESITNIIALQDGTYLCVGTTSSNDGDVSGNHGDKDIWMINIDRSGDIIWKKCFGGSKTETAGNIRQNKDGSIYFIGTTNSANGDVSGFHPGSSSFTNDMWVLKLDAAGNIVWQKCLGGTSEDTGSDIIEGDGKSFYITGIISSEDGDFTSIRHTSSPDGFFVKFDSTKKMVGFKGLFMSTPRQIVGLPGNKFHLNAEAIYCNPAHPLTGTQLQEFTDVTSSNIIGKFGAFDPIGNCWPSALDYNGFYRSSGPSALMTVNNGASDIYAISTNDYKGNPSITGGYDGFISEVKPSTGIAWKKLIGGTGTDFLVSVTPYSESEFVVCGYTNSNNGDVSGNHGGYDYWVVKLGQVNRINGNIFLDYNVNGVKDINEPYTENYIVESRKGASVTASSAYNGFFSNAVDTGTYSTSVIATLPYYSVAPATKTSIFTNYNSFDSFSFAMQPVPGYKDLAINLSAGMRLRPGFTVMYDLYYRNQGTDTLIDKPVVLIIDSRLQFFSAVPAPTKISGDTITWNIAKLSPRESGRITVQLKAPPPPALNFNDVVINTATIDSAGDVKPLDNISTRREIVGGSYDPNDKQENANGAIALKDIIDNKNLTYTIRFQNTGNDTAFTVIVQDTLDAKLNWNSIEMISASHPYQLTIKDGRYCTWQFDNILLVDSIHNEPLSHGYFTYIITPKNTLVTGDSIRNNASIYFDFNPPVKTNTQVTVVKPNPVLVPQINGMQSSYCINAGVQKGKITNLPPAASGINVSVKLDANTLSVAADSSFSFDLTALPAGAHNLLVSFGTDTLRYNFTITPAAAPDVNLATTITTIINLTDPVIITASNAAGGGATPHYTFAKDKSFTNILQAESSSNQYTVSPVTLPMGDNWVYVKMKTSVTCYTTQTNIDSIKLYKLLVPDQPVVTGNSSSYCGSTGEQKWKITNIPPANYLATTAVKLDGSVVLTIAADSTFSILPSSIAAGNHTVTVVFTNASGNKTNTINFSIGQQVTPNVNLSASITNVTNLTDPIIITATNAAGGGTSPKYSFAKDKAFTNVLQAESNSNTLTIQPNTLTVGSNWVYVKMKTSDTCYTAQTNTDSINIERSPVTGLADVDFPGQAINVFPNPFSNIINVNGLNTGKTYSIIISNASGQQVYTQQVSNSRTMVINKMGLASGRYLLSIYDAKKRRLIGSIRLIKE